MKRVLATALLCAAPALAMAQDWKDDLYWGASLTGFRLSVDGLDSAIKPIGGSLRLGYELTERFAVEARAGLTGSDDLTNAAGTIAYSIPYYAAVFGRFDITTGDARLYALLGGTYAKLNREEEISSIDSPDGTEGGLSYGVGLDLYGNEHVAVTVEYIRHLNDSDYYLDAWNIGFTYSY